MSRKLLDGKLPVSQGKGGVQKELTREIIDKAVSALRIGSPTGTAFAFQGISYDTLRSWALKGREDPNSLCGELIRRVETAIADWELRDLSVIDKHAMGAPAEYEMEVARSPKGEALRDAAGNVIMQVARDPDGKAILKRPAIQSDWRPALERLSRRRSKLWGRTDTIEFDAVLSFDNKKPESREAMTFDERIAIAIKKFDDNL